MKSNNHLSLYFSPQLAQAETTEPQASVQTSRSPYLKAILSGASRLINSGKIISIANPDREAAIRYIRESAMLKK
jgi:hypothetical protein